MRVWPLAAKGILGPPPLMAGVAQRSDSGLGGPGLEGVLKRGRVGVAEEMDPRHLSCVPACVSPFLGQWGPAVYLCYKVGLAKANTLVYEAGE